jgi:hypothetical protein
MFSKELMRKNEYCLFHNCFFSLRQRSLQYLTSSQTRFHFFLHEKGRPQLKQVFCGRNVFFNSGRFQFRQKIRMPFHKFFALFPVCKK